MRKYGGLLRSYRIGTVRLRASLNLHELDDDATLDTLDTQPT